MKALLAAAITAIAAAQCDLDCLLDRGRWALAWPQPANIPSTVEQALGFAATLNATCYWPDINYDDPHDRANWLTFNHLGRVTTMTQALTVPGSSVFEDPKLSAAVHCALGVWLQRGWVNDNWWYQWIGVEINLQSQFMMLGQNRTTPQEQAALVQYSYNSAWWVNPWGGGANLVWMIQVEIMRGLASGNTTALTEGFTAMWDNVVQGSATANWQGIVSDLSYHFHGEQILSSAYGLEWLQNVLNFYVVAAGSDYDMPAEKLTLLAQFIAEGDAQLTFGSCWDYGTQGRGIDRPEMYFTWSLPTPAIRILANTTEAAPWASTLVAFADAVDGVPPSMPSAVTTSAKHFFSSDFYVHHRPNWGASVKMHGNNGYYRIVQNECDNSENLLSEHTGDGVLNVVTSGDLLAMEDAYYAIFPLWDWQGINGITVEHDVPLETCEGNDQWPVRDTAFVGGATDGAGVYGAVAMDTATHNLTAQRAWFFFDSGIVATASNMTDPTKANVRTSLASRLVADAVRNPVQGKLTVGLTPAAGGGIVQPADGNYSWPAVNVSWLNAGGLGIIPVATGVSLNVGAAGLGVGASIGNKTAPWSTIGPFPGSASGRLFSAWLDHGRQLNNQSYAYILVPNITAAAMPAAVSAQAGTACILASNAVHGASQPPATGNSGGVASTVFWTSGTYSCSAGAWNMAVSADSEAIVVVRDGVSKKHG